MTMPTLSNELRQQIDKAITCDVGCGHDTGFEACYEHQIDRLVKLFATQNTALLKELLANIPKKVDVVDDPFGEKQLSYINYREQGYNQAVDETIEVINSKLAAMGEQ